MSASNTSSNNTNGKLKKKAPPQPGVDAFLTQHGKGLAVGQRLSIRLIKGPSTMESADPVDPKAPTESFPLIAKFGDSVVRPSFGTKKRLYQQDAPKAVDDSDDEEAADAPQPKKRWRSRRKEAPVRQWVLQEEAEFLETMIARREKRETTDAKQASTSSRYEGLPEQNTSSYAILRLVPDDAVIRHPDVVEDGGGRARCLQVCPVPTPNAIVAFSQPASRKTFSLSQAERVINDQRNGVKTLHHLHKDESAAAAVARMPLMGGRGVDKKKADSKSRLMNKLNKIASSRHDGEVDDGDDVMADVAYRNRKGAGGARKELLQTVGNGVKVSDEGVLGGSNDAEFGGRQRFAQFKADKDDANKNAKQGAAAGGGAEGGHTSERGADGAAMADNFYQRDVQAEYEELDYDANEQFDDDDVDVGEADVQVETGGYGGLDDDDEDDEDELEGADEEAVAGVEGLASVAGFKLLLAKANGEVTIPQGGEEADANGSAAPNGVTSTGQGRVVSRKDKDQNDHYSKILAATGRQRSNKRGDAQPMEVESASDAAAVAPTSAPTPMDTSAELVNQRGPDGLRILTLEAVRREIWLNYGTMETKRLMKIFDVRKKSSPERRENFRKIIKDLCNIQQDPVKGNVMVLKQHWSRMG
jgi:hypothetical protein